MLQKYLNNKEFGCKKLELEQSQSEKKILELVQRKTTEILEIN